MFPSSAPKPHAPTYNLGTETTTRTSPSRRQRPSRQSRPSLALGIVPFHSKALRTNGSSCKLSSSPRLRALTTWSCVVMETPSPSYPTCFVTHGFLLFMLLCKVVEAKNKWQRTRFLSLISTKWCIVRFCCKALWMVKKKKKRVKNVIQCERKTATYLTVLKRRCIWSKKKKSFYHWQPVDSPPA